MRFTRREAADLEIIKMLVDAGLDVVGEATIITWAYWVG